MRRMTVRWMLSLLLILAVCVPLTAAAYAVSAPPEAGDEAEEVPGDDPGVAPEENAEELPEGSLPAVSEEEQPAIPEEESDVVPEEEPAELYAAAPTSGTCGENLTWVFDEGTGTLTISGTGAMEDYASTSSPWYTIRSKILHIVITPGLTAIGTYAFPSCTKLGSVSIPEGVTTIGNSAFYNCSALASVDIPNGTIDIGDSAFNRCSSLVSVSIPEGVVSIGQRAFNECRRLLEIEIPNGVTKIGRSTFYRCTELRSVILPDSVSSIEGYAFQDCSSLSHLVIPNATASDRIFDGCTSLLTAGPIGGGYNLEFGWTDTIPEKAFFYCPNLTSVTVPSGITGIGKNAFCGCTALKEVFLSEGLTSIGERAFYNCSNLAGINIPTSMTSIGNYAFTQCTSLLEIEIPNGITQISGGTFSRCTELRKVVLSESITTIGSDAFRDCSNLSSFIMPSTAGTMPSSGAFVGCTSLITAGPIGGGYNMEFGWTEAVPDYAFTGCPGLSGITIPEGVTSIGRGAFSGCSNLMDVSLPESLASIGVQAFEACTALTDIAIPSNIEQIGGSAFRDSTGLKSVQIPGNMLKLGDWAFYGCTNLESVIMEDGVYSIGTKAFTGCTSLVYVKIPASVKAVGEAVFLDCTELVSAGPAGGGYTIEFEWTDVIPSTLFQKCSNLTRVVIPEGITKLPRFSECVNLTSVITPSTLEGNCLGAFTGIAGLTSAGPVGSDCSIQYGWTTAIPDNAFRTCSTLTRIVLPEGITTIGEYAFSSCTALPDIILPEGLTSIGYMAFYGCNVLLSITIPDSVTTISSNAFTMCCNLTEVTLPNKLSQIPNNLFSGCTALKHIEIPQSVTHIYYEAFRECSALTEVILPEGLTLIGEKAFFDCTSLSHVVIPESLTNIGDDVFTGCGKLTSAGPSGGGYNIEFGWRTTIPENAFRACDALAEITLPESLTEIGRWAFGECTSLPYIKIPESVASISEAAFAYCPLLTSAGPVGGGYTVEFDWTRIPAYAFKYMDSLTEIIIPETVASIGTKAFESCDGLTEIILPRSLSTIGEGAFRFCDNLSHVVIKSPTVAIESPSSGGYSEGFFYGCANLTSAGPIGGGYGIEYAWNEEIPQYAFDNCTGLVGIVFPRSIKSIGHYAFRNCISLTAVAFPANIQSVGYYAFKNCSKLTKVGLPNDSVKYTNHVGANAEIYYHGGPTAWENYCKENNITPSEDLIIHYYSTLYPDIPQRRTYITTGSVNQIRMGDIDVPVGSFTVYPSSGSTSGRVTWTSSDNSVFRVTGGSAYYAGSKKVTVYGSAVSEGTATVNIKSTDGASASFDVTVQPNNVLEIVTGGDRTVEHGKQDALVASFSVRTHDDSVTGSLTWISSNPEVFELTGDDVVDGVGKGTYGGWGGDLFNSNFVQGNALSVGTSTITATTDTGVSASFDVKVTAVDSSVKLSRGKQPNSDEAQLKVGDGAGSVSASIVFGSYVSKNELTWTWTIDEGGRDIISFSEDGQTATVSRSMTFEEGEPLAKTYDKIPVYPLRSGKATVRCTLSDGTEKLVEIISYSEAEQILKESFEAWMAAYNQWSAAADEVIHNKANEDINLEEAKEPAKILQKAQTMVIPPAFTTSTDSEWVLRINEAVLVMLAEDVGTEMALKKVDASDITEIPTNIVNAVAADFQNRTRLFKDPNGEYEIYIDLLDAAGAVDGSAVYTDLKTGKKLQAAVVSTESVVRQVLGDYVHAMIKWEEYVAVQSLKEMYKDLTTGLFGKEVGTLSSAAIDKVFAKYGDAFAKTVKEETGDMQKLIANSINYYGFLKGMLSGDCSGMETMISQVRNIQFSTDSGRDQLVNEMRKQIQKCSDTLKEQMEQYAKDPTKVKRKKDSGGFPFELLIQCPVDVTVYNSSGEQIGFVGDSAETYYNESVLYIERTSDVKKIYSKENDITLQITGTGDGTLNCTFLELSDNGEVGRVNYYDIPLEKGTSISAAVSDAAAGSDGDVSLQVSVTADNVLVPANAEISAGAYAGQAVQVYCGTNAPEGGNVYGMGEYVPGDPVMVQASPADGYSFVCWVDDSGTLASASRVYEFTAREDVALTALFAENAVDEGEPVVTAVLNGNNRKQAELTDTYQLLESGAKIFAAHYQDGKLLEVLSGALNGSTVMFSGEIDTEWTLFFLSGDTYAPLCGKVAVSE